MSDPVEVALITAGGLVVSGGLSTAVIILLKQYGTKIDGRMDDLIRTTKDLANAIGHRQGVKDEQDRTTKGI